MIELKSSLIANNCEFIGGSTAIQISIRAKEVEIYHCTFTDCGHMYTFDKYCAEFGCILVDNKWFGLTANGIQLVQIKCVGNVFENNLCYTIVERHAIDNTRFSE